MGWKSAKGQPYRQVRGCARFLPLQIRALVQLVRTVTAKYLSSLKLKTENFLCSLIRTRRPLECLCRMTTSCPGLMLRCQHHVCRAVMTETTSTWRAALRPNVQSTDNDSALLYYLWNWRLDDIAGHRVKLRSAGTTQGRIPGRYNQHLGDTTPEDELWASTVTKVKVLGKEWWENDIAILCIVVQFPPHAIDLRGLGLTIRRQHVSATKLYFSLTISAVHKLYVYTNQRDEIQLDKDLLTKANLQSSP